MKATPQSNPLWEEPPVRVQYPHPLNPFGNAAETETRTQVLLFSLLHLRPATALCISMKMHKFLFVLNFRRRFFLLHDAYLVALAASLPIAQSCRPSRGINQFGGSGQEKRHQKNTKKIYQHA